MISIKKREDEFFSYLKVFADKVYEGAEVFNDLVKDYTDIEGKVIRIKEIEVECDSLGHEILVAINNSFVTPFDREDLYTIVKELDDVMDSIETISSRFKIFDIKELTDNCRQMTNVIHQAAKELSILMTHLSQFKKNNIVREQIIEVNRLENEGDTLYRESLISLFRDEKDPIEIIKWKQLYEELEGCIDNCEDVANVIEGLVMKYA